MQGYDQTELDRRRFRRRPPHPRTRASYYVRGGSADLPVAAVLLNVSEKGALLFSTGGPEIGTAIELKLTPPVGEPVYVPATVVWSEATDAPGVFRIGVEFAELLAFPRLQAVAFG